MTTINWESIHQSAIGAMNMAYVASLPVATLKTPATVLACVLNVV
jgi:hypothetical protein